MRRVTCPYLGLKDDPTTTLNFPSSGNFCHQARPIAPVKGAYQETHCLTANHTACPLYQASHPMALPASIAGKAAPTFTGRQVFALLSVPFMVVAVAFFTYFWSSLGWGNWMGQPIPDTGPGVVDNSFGLLGAGSSISRTPFSPSVTGETPQAPKNDCPLPINWIAYIVKPTDSLFRLSVIYGVSVEDLQQVNCMGDQTVILPGQVIYVPFIPTNTPMDTLIQPPQVLPTQTPPANQLPRLPTSTSEPPAQPTTAATEIPTSTPVLPTELPTSIPLPTDIIPTLPPLFPTATDTVPTSEPTSLPTDEPTPLPTDEPPPLPTDEPPPLPTDEPPPQPTDEPPPLPTVELPPLPTVELPPLLPTEPQPLPTTEPPSTTTEPPPLPTSEPPSPPTTEPPPPTDEPTPLLNTEPPPLPTSEPPPSPTEPPPPTSEPTTAPSLPTEPPQSTTEPLPIPTIDVIEL